MFIPSNVGNEVNGGSKCSKFVNRQQIPNSCEYVFLFDPDFSIKMYMSTDPTWTLLGSVSCMTTQN